MALADNHISDEEKAFIDRLAIYLEIEPDTLDKILASPEDFKTDPPSNKKSRLERLYDLSKMIYADQIADDNEKKLLEKMVIGLGFETENSRDIVKKALEMVSKGIDQDDFVDTFEI